MINLGFLAAQFALALHVDLAVPKRLERLPYWRQWWPLTRKVAMCSRRESIYVFVAIFAVLVVSMTVMSAFPSGVNELYPAAIIVGTVWTVLQAFWAARLLLWARKTSA